MVFPPFGANCGEYKPHITGNDRKKTRLNVYGKKISM